MSQSDLSADIKAAIQKNLPAEVADSLRAYLAQAEKDKTEIEQLNSTVKGQGQLVADQRASIDSLTAKLAKHADLDGREKIVSEREHKIKVEIAELKMTEAEKRATELRNVLEIVFKSPVYRRTVSKHCNYPGSENLSEETTEV